MNSNILYNGGILVVPVLLITFGLWNYLPTAYSQENFSQPIPDKLELFEDILRVLIFIIPLILIYGASNRAQLLGWFLYAVGLFIYASSYLTQILFSSSTWSTSIIGFTAPAWSPIFWLYGIALICNRSWLFSWWSSYIYFTIATIFVVVHTYHAFLVYSQLAHANNA